MYKYSIILSKNDVIRCVVTVFLTFIFLSSITQAQTLLDQDIFDSDCVKQSVEWQKSINTKTRTKSTDLVESVSNLQFSRNDSLRNSKPVVFVYTTNGEICYQSHLRVKQGDQVYIGVHGKANEIKNLKRTTLVCSQQSAELTLLDTLNIENYNTKPSAASNITDFLASSINTIYKFSPKECFGENIEFRIDDGEGNAKFSKTISQYTRHRGTFQVGVAWTTLHDRDFAISNTNGERLVTVDQDDNRGPAYVGSLVVYGLPHYIESMFGNGLYAGRDIVNENNWKDSLGLLISIGLDEPKDTLGIGLTYELVTGINITASAFYRNITSLNGVSLGEEMVDGVDTIPTKKSWENEIVFGLSVDGRYLTKFFGGS